MNRRAPNRDKASDGSIGDEEYATRDSDHKGHGRRLGVVAAIDITLDPAGGCDAAALAEAIRAAQDSRVKYVIWNRRIMSSTRQPWTWREYNGSNPHNKHVHISVRPNKSNYDSGDPWAV